jgi:2-iminobutanoate/2-iminopropanoate deaminase
MKTIRSPKVAEAPPQTWSNMKVVNGYFHIAGMTGSGPEGEHPGDRPAPRAQRLDSEV